MNRLKIAILLALVVCVATVLIGLNGCGGGSSSGSQGKHFPPGAINHVVIIFQENRSPDNLFQDAVLIQRGAEIKNYGFDKNGNKVLLQPGPLVTSYDLDHSHDGFLAQCDWDGTKCVMDGSQGPAFGYVKDALIQPYYTMAETYTFGDHMFQTNQGPSFPAHQYILSGTAAVCVPGGSCPQSTTSTVFDVSNMTNNQRLDTSRWAGCLAPPASVTKALDTSQPFPFANYIQLNGPACFEHPTLTDVLDRHSLTWKYYAPLQGSIWVGPNVIQHMCVPFSKDGKYDDTICSGPDWTNPNPNVVIEGAGAQVITDIQNGQLAAVTWVIPDGTASDHPSENTGLGPSWVASIVNAIGTSNFWADTAIIVAWDDWGGWYDHVAPTIHSTNSYEFGFRVPLIVISPYAKPAYVSHAPEDFGSILKFIEEAFALPEIDPAVGYADSYALGDLSDCFNFKQTPLTFTPIKAAYSKEHFLHNKAEPTPPDND